MSGRSLWGVRLAVSAAVLAALLWFVPVAALVRAVRTVSPAVVIGAVALFLCGHLVAALKWRLLVRDERASVALVVRAHFAGLVANLCLPSVAGGDVVRAGWLIRTIGAGETVAVGSMADRGIDVAALAGLAAVGWTVTRGPESPASRLVMPGAVVVATGFALGLLVARLLARRYGAGVLGRVGAAIRALGGRPLLLLGALAMSMTVQSAFVLVNVWLAGAVGVGVSAARWFVAWPIAKLVALVPISLGGIGVREAALAGLLTPAGASAPAVVAVGFLWELVLVTGGLIGWGVTTVSAWTAPGGEASRQ